MTRDRPTGEKGFVKTRFREVIKLYERDSSLTYETLQSLCEAHPSHEAMREVKAKILIIGRTFAAQIERKVASDKSQGSSAGTVASHFVKHGKKIDKWITEIPTGDRLSEEGLSVVLRNHARLVKLLSNITIKKQDVPSFASKYLHFHRPIVPIYDSEARRALRRLVPLKRDRARPKLDKDPYRIFVMRLRELNRQAIEDHEQPTIRELDQYLMAEAKRMPRRRGKKRKSI